MRYLKEVHRKKISCVDTLYTPANGRDLIVHGLYMWCYIRTLLESAEYRL